jgi:hypothetical protein
LFSPGAVQGSALRDYGGNRWDFREVFSFPGAAKLLDTDLVQVDDAVKFDGSVRVDDLVELVDGGEVDENFSSTPGDESTCSSVTVPVSPEL